MPTRRTEPAAAPSEDTPSSSHDQETREEETSESVSEPTAPASSLAGEPDCATWATGRAGTPIVSQRIRRYPSDVYVTEGLFESVSVQRTGASLRVRWWAEDRGCSFTTELVRSDEVLILREAHDPRARCAIVGAARMETRIPLLPSDRRVCLPGLRAPIDLDDLRPWAAPLVDPPRRTSRARERIDPWEL